MKTRNGYVSNSSSSSFIVMYNDGSKLVMKGSKRGSKKFDFTIQDFIDMVEHSPDYSSDCTGIVADGIENVESYLTEKDSYGCSNCDEEWSKEILDRMSRNRDKFSEAMIVRVAYDDKFVRKMLEAFLSSGEAISLDEGEC